MNDRFETNYMQPTQCKIIHKLYTTANSGVNGSQYHLLLPKVNVFICKVICMFFKYGKLLDVQNACN